MRETGPLRVWAYARTADPAPHALEEQLAGLCRETARRGYQLINCGMDACRPNCLHRPALFTMMKAVREHQVDAVMVTRLSRISYSGRWMFYFLCFLQDNGVLLITTEYELHYMVYQRGFERPLLARAAQCGCVPWLTCWEETDMEWEGDDNERSTAF